MNYLFNLDLKPFQINLEYVPEELSFIAEGANLEGFSSLVINDLNLEVSAEGRVMYPWGYAPLENPNLIYETPKADKWAQGGLFIQPNLIPGVSKRINKKSRWLVHFNKEKNWVCFGNPKVDLEMFMFASGCLATFDKGQLVAIWIIECKGLTSAAIKDLSASR